MTTSTASQRRILFISSLAAGGLLFILCVLTLISGVSQQDFEWVSQPAAYAAALQRDASWLRFIIAVDDAFIAAYVTATLALAAWLARGRWDAMTVTIAAFGVAAGVLDLHENHALLAMVRWVEQGGSIAADAILTRSELSQLKWMLGHAAFVLVGARWAPAAGRAQLLDRVLIWSLVAFQLPLGATTWALADPGAIAVATWARYASFLAGFCTIGWLLRARPTTTANRGPEPAPGDADATGAPA